MHLLDVVRRLFEFLFKVFEQAVVLLLFQKGKDLLGVVDGFFGGVEGFRFALDRRDLLGELARPFQIRPDFLFFRFRFLFRKFFSQLG